MELLLNIIQLGLIYVPVVLGVFFTSRLIRLDDLTLEGSFNLGGALCAALLIGGCPSLLAFLLVALAGAVAGGITAFLHTRLGINHLISGLAMSAALYSIALKLCSAHCVLSSGCTLFDPLEGFMGEVGSKTGVLLLVGGLLLWGVSKLLATEVGLLLKAVGSNPKMLTLLGKSPIRYQTLGLMLANSLAAISGMLFVQWLGFYSITNYIGTWIAGLNGLMMAELVPLPWSLGLLMGSLLNQLLFAAVIELQLDPLWNQALKALSVVILLRLAALPSSTSRGRHVAAPTN